MNFNKDVGLIINIFIIITPAMTHGYELTVLHTNDVHARIQEMNAFGGQCSSGSSNCFGGVARIKTKVEELRREHRNTLLLDAGDQYQGTLWFTHYGGYVTHTMMNLIGYDAMALGNHEFDNNIDGVLPLLQNANFTILSANINLETEARIKPYVSKSYVTEVGGEKIGVIGYTTKDTPMISQPGSLKFEDEVTSIRAEVKKLESQGVNKIIALGHAGFSVDTKIANQVEGVDVVVGGHTNTFLYKGTAPSVEKPVGEYPHVIEKSNGERTLVVQDYAFGKYLGFLQVEFDNNGKVVSFGGNPIILNNSVAKDTKVQNIVDNLFLEIENATKKVIGRSLVKMEGNRAVCRLRECNMGNLVADSFVHMNLRDADTINSTRVFIALVNSGSIRSSFERGSITLGNAIEVQPYRNTMDTIQLPGRNLRQALEYSVTSYDEEDPDGGFLQISGIRVKYNLQKPEGQRVVDVKVLCSECEVPEFVSLKDEKLYDIVLSNFLLNGGDGYTMIKDNAIQKHVVGILDTDVFAEYIKLMSPLTTGLDGRIEMVDDNGCDDTSGGSRFISNSFLLIETLILVCAVVTI
ncbi:snake venom 5'-nucleotidase-like [Saccostrea echinata]|uniref:snake venom 5'-nucleotidase-like n=1 Tax=Saccostrea echinata TaxID=191078 RepID=UPI002A7F712B|nr:snake venom 5'-nucleotidase-like [Saccostrea echinata]